MTDISIKSMHTEQIGILVLLTALLEDLPVAGIAKKIEKMNIMVCDGYPTTLVTPYATLPFGWMILSYIILLY